VSGFHGGKGLIHPALGWIGECALATGGAGAYLVSEHALHLRRGQIDGRGIIAVVLKAESIDIGTKTAIVYFRSL